MSRLPRCVFYVFGACIFVLAAAAQAQIGRPASRSPSFGTSAGLARVLIESTKVTARVVDGIASTKVKFRLRNNGSRPAEKILLLPLPKGATADGLELWIGGKPQKGEALDKARAREVYQSIVRKRRDPALLEYVDRGTLRLRVFPIPGHGTQDVELRFRMLLPNSGGMLRWGFPCRAIGDGKFSIDFRLESKKAIKSVWSPIQGFDIVQKGDHLARASYESTRRPSRDPVIFYGLSERDFGLDLLCYNEGLAEEIAGQKRQQAEGYFVALIAPKRDWKNEPQIRKSIHFVIDSSGSMRGKKIEQARKALRFFLASLRPNDYFNVVPFSTEARPFFASPQLASKEKLATALDRCKGLEARGGTNISDALTRVLAVDPAPDCVPIVVFLTDGLASVGTTDETQLLADCRRVNHKRARIFVFGVGNDVNTRLLDSLAEDTRGTRDYVAPGEDLEVKTSALFQRLAYPVMTDLEIVADGIQLERLAPQRLPDLFRGNQLVVAGRYRGHGSIALRLKGKIAGDSKEFIYDAEFPAKQMDNDFVASLWAQRRIGQLVDALRLKGQNSELISEVQRLGREHGIVTPWTSQLVAEESARLRRFARGQIAGHGAGGFYRGPGDKISGDVSKHARGGPTTGGPTTGRQANSGPSSPGPDQRGRRGAQTLEDIALGRGTRKQAVEASKLSAALRYRKTVREGRRASLRSKRIGACVFVYVAGVWVDRKLDDRLAKHVTRITAFSKEYFGVLEKHPELAKAFAFSSSILVILEGRAVQILPPGRKV